MNCKQRIRIERRRTQLVVMSCEGYLKRVLYSRGKHELYNKDKQEGGHIIVKPYKCANGNTHNGPLDETQQKADGKVPLPVVVGF